MGYSAPGASPLKARKEAQERKRRYLPFYGQRMAPAAVIEHGVIAPEGDVGERPKFQVEKSVLRGFRPEAGLVRFGAGGAVALLATPKCLARQLHAMRHQTVR